MRWLYGRIGDYTESEYDAVYKGLSASRKARIDKRKSESDKKRSLLAVLLLNRLLAEEGIEDAVLENSENGRPFIRNRSLFISISHKGEIAVCAISKDPIGIDVEKVGPFNPKLLQRVCTQAEIDFVGCGLDKEERFFEIWTAKEAYFKKMGTGITDFKSINILSLNRTVHRVGEYIIQIIV